MPVIIKKIDTLFASFRALTGGEKGNVSTIFAFSLIPILGLVGLGVDYGVALTDKSKLDNAADAAALAAVSTAKAYVAANPTDPNLTANAKSAGTDRGMRSFTVNAGNLPFAQNPTYYAGSLPSAQIPAYNVDVQRTSQSFSATVSYQTITQNHFGQLFGTPNIKLKGTAAAAADIPSYLDFYLLVDVSGSMGLPSTAAGQTQLAGINRDNYSVYKQGCQFACHFPGYTGYNLAMTNSIQLRSGAVNSAVCALLAKAALPAVPNQYRIGLYPFVTMMGTLAPISSNYSNLATLATCSASTPSAFTQLLDTGTTQLPVGGDPSTGTGSGGTDISTVFSQIYNAGTSPIISYNDGSSSTNSRPFVFLITDGMYNPQHYATTKGGRYYYPGNPSTYPGYGAANFDGLRPPKAVDPSWCDNLKKKGATISILYIPYTPLSYATDPYNENASTNAAIPDLPIELTQCASSGFFYTANTPSDITAALNSMFNQAIQVTHLSQ